MTDPRPFGEMEDEVVVQLKQKAKDSMPFCQQLMQDICQGYEYGFSKLRQIPGVESTLENIHAGFEELGKNEFVSGTIECADHLCTQVHDVVFDSLYDLFGIQKTDKK